MQPIHDELTMEQGLHAMAMKLVFKDIENKKPWGYLDFKMTFLKEGTLDVTQHYLHTRLHDPDYSRQDEDSSYDSMPTSVSGENSSHDSMPSLTQRAYESDSDSDLESTKDVTELYTYGELDDEWSEDQMVLQDSESMDAEMTNWRRNLMNLETNFALGNPQQAFPGSLELLKSADIWIGDTGATNHTTFSKEGSKNVKESSISTHGITGETIKPDNEIDIECVHYDQYGNVSQSGLTFSGVSYMKGCNYNLCSLSKMLQDGWKMSGNTKAITMRRGSMEIIFDIIIPTKNGALYCACFKRVR